LKKEQEIVSPTYVYYNKYGENYHFDLYRLSGYEEFIQIAGEEILDNNTGIILIEWPDILEGKYTPDIEISLEKIQDNEGVRRVKIVDLRIPTPQYS